MLYSKEKHNLNRRRYQMKFYNVRKKAAVEIPDEQCTKRIYVKRNPDGTMSNKKTYGVTAVDDDGTKCTKFLKKDVYEALKCKEA